MKVGKSVHIHSRMVRFTEMLKPAILAAKHFHIFLGMNISQFVCILMGERGVAHCRYCQQSYSGGE